MPNVTVELVTKKEVNQKMRKTPVRVISISYDFDKIFKVSGCRKCFMENGFHVSGCPDEFIVCK